MEGNRRIPPWIKARIPSGEQYQTIRHLTKELKLHTVCESACCPNQAECWGAGTATFMILGGICTRGCRFCAVPTGRPQGLDEDEPLRVAEAVQSLKLRHVVITSVDRDDLADGGAGIFAHTIQEIKRRCPTSTVEVLIPDFRGSRSSLLAVLQAHPDVLNHNIETVPRLYRRVRPGADYQQSLALLQLAKSLYPELPTKTGLMVGVGETLQELRQVMADLVKTARVDILTIGQYLQPTKGHLTVDRYYTPEEFGALKEVALQIGFRYVEAGPLVRSSYHAERAMGLHAASGHKGRGAVGART